MRAYKPRRAAARWLEGAPTEVLDMFDAGPELADRYTVLFGGRYLMCRDDDTPHSLLNTIVPYLALGSNPRSPQGFCQWGEMAAYEAADFRYRSARQRIAWGDLPAEVRDVVLYELTDNQE